LVSFCLTIFSCENELSNEDINESLDPKIEDELKAEVNEYKIANESKIIKFENQIEIAKNKVNEIKFDDIVNYNRSNFGDVNISNNCFIISIHEYDTLNSLENVETNLENTNHSIARRSIIRSFPTKSEGDVIRLNEYLSNSTSDFYSSEEKLSMFLAISKRMDNYMASKYILIIKDYLYIKPTVGYSNFEPGEIVSGVFLYNIELNAVEDQFIVKSMNELHIKINEDDEDTEENRMKIQKKLVEALLSNYNKSIEAKLKEYYFNDEVDVFY